MITNSEKLQQIIELSGNCVNLGRQLKANHPGLHQWVLVNTRFLDSKPRLKFNERCYCLINNIMTIQKNDFGDQARFINIFKGYSMLTKTVDKRKKKIQKAIARKEKKSQRELLNQQRKLKTVLDLFIDRNKKRNSHLYQDNLIEGYDYVLCPISGQRMSMINNDYIIKILKMDPADYPNVQRISEKRMENVKAGLNKVDPMTGLTAHQKAVLKTQEKLNQIDPITGLTFHKIRTQKTRMTHMNKIDEFGRNGYRRQADARLTTILENGLTVEQNAHRKQKETLIRNNSTGTGGASKISKKVLLPILEILDKNSVKYYFDRREFGIKDTDSDRYYFYDLTIPDLKLAIEYQSKAYHANPKWSMKELNQWKPPKGTRKTFSESIQYDQEKKDALLKFRNFEVKYVWEDSTETDIEEIKCLLKTHNMKF